MHHQGLSDRHSFLHAARKLMRVLVHIRRPQSQAPQELPSLGFQGTAITPVRRPQPAEDAAAGILRAEHHVAQRGAIREERVLLRYVSAARIDSRYRVAVNCDGAAGWEL